MRYILLIVIYCLGPTSCSSPASGQMERYLDAGFSEVEKYKAYYSETLKPANGKYAYQLKLADGQVIQEGYFESEREEIKTGEWTYFFKNGQVKQNGNFSEDEKTGEWTLYRKNGSVNAKGPYEKGQRNGEWIFYHDNGQEAGEVTFFNNTIIKQQYWQPDGTTLPESRQANRSARFPGGERALFTWLEEAVNEKELPAALPRGTVSVQCIINVEGMVNEARIKTSLHPTADSLALEIVNELPRWEPARSFNRPIATQYVLPVRFE
jgi:hypothetical protein